MDQLFNEIKELIEATIQIWDQTTLSDHIDQLIANKHSDKDVTELTTEEKVRVAKVHFEGDTPVVVHEFFTPSELKNIVLTHNQEHIVNNLNVLTGYIELLRSRQKEQTDRINALTDLLKVQ